MEPIIHFLLPILFLLAIFPEIKKDLVIKLAILTVLPDFDIFIPGMHRIAFGNIFFATVIILFIYLKLGKKASYIATFFLTSHLILDMKKPGTALFWPLYNKFIYLESEILQIGNKLIPKFEITTITLEQKAQFITAQEIHYLNTQGSLFILLIIILLISKYYLTETNKKTSTVQNS